MKKIFTLTLAALFVSLISFAADRPRPGKITVTTFDNASVIVKIDGRRYDLNRNRAVLDNLRPGNHSIEILKYEGRGGIFGGRRLRTIYSTNMFVGQAQLVDININRFGQVNVQKSSYGRDDRDDRGRDWGSNDRNDRDRDHRGGRY
jgi:hypothetical protein